MKTRIYVYKGVIGIQGGDTFLHQQSGPDETPCCMVAGSEVELSREAYDLILQIPKSNKGYGDFDVFRTGDQGVVVAWVGKKERMVIARESFGSRMFNPSLLEQFVVEGVEPPEAFTTFVDQLTDPSRLTNVGEHMGVVGIEVGARVTAAAPGKWIMVPLDSVQITQNAFDIISQYPREEV